MRLILVRHGETEWNRHKLTQGMSDTALSDTGVWQAQRLGRRLQRMGIAAVYSSPLLRAAETGRIIAEAGGYPLWKDDALREIHFGNWEGLTFEQISKRFPESFEQWNASPYCCDVPGATETLVDVQQRTADFVARTSQKHEKNCIVIVSHSVPCKLLITSAIGLPLESIHSIRLDNASMSMIEYYPQRPVLRLMNDISHLRY